VCLDNYTGIAKIDRKKSSATNGTNAYFCFVTNAEKVLRQGKHNSTKP